MASQVISFRMSGDAIAQLRERAKAGESDSQAAQRLLNELLGTAKEEIEISEVDSRIQEAIEPLISRLEQLEQRLQGEKTGEPTSATEIGVIKSQKQLQAEGLISYRQLKQAKEGSEITANDGSIWEFEGREPGANGVKKFRCVSLGKIQGERAA